MKYLFDIKEIRDELDTIPKEYRVAFRKAVRCAYNRGASDFQSLVLDLSGIPSDKVSEYVVCHESDTDGG